MLSVILIVLAVYIYSSIAMLFVVEEIGGNRNSLTFRDSVILVLTAWVAFPFMLLILLVEGIRDNLP